MPNLHGIRIYNCEVESILAFISLTVFKLLAEAQMEVQHCESLCWQLPVWNELVLTARFIYHLLLSCCFLFANHYICRRFQHDSWSVAVSWCSARRGFFFLSLDLGSSHTCARFHFMSECLSWPDITALDWAGEGDLLSSHSSKHCRPEISQTMTEMACLWGDATQSPNVLSFDKHLVY